MKYTNSYLNELTKYVEDMRWNSFCGKTILITGVTGMIGSALADLLCFASEKYDLRIQVIGVVRSLDRAEQRFGVLFRNKVGDFRIVEHDVIHRLELDESVDYIVHAASNAYPAVFASEPVETMLANFDGTHHMLELARLTGARLLYVSSGEVYGETDKEIKTETDYGYVDSMLPRSCYPNGKRAAETLCAAYVAEYGVEAVVARPSHVYGPTMTSRDNRAVSEFIREVVAGHDIELRSSGQMVRTYTYVLDVATALLTLLDRGYSGEAYNVADADSVVSLRELAELIAAAGNRQVVFKHISDTDSASCTPISRQVMSDDKLRALGWQCRCDIKTGIAVTLASLR